MRAFIRCCLGPTVLEYNKCDSETTTTSDGDDGDNIKFWNLIWLQMCVETGKQRWDVM